MAAILAQNLGKRFRRYHGSRAWTLKDVFVNPRLLLSRPEMFWALRNVNFQVDHGQTLGVLGRNGAGKSTLLRLLGRISQPDEGTLSSAGRICGLLELGAGFHPDLTGRENVFVCGVIAGRRRQEIAARLESIVEFAELADFIDSPLRTYSSGMQMRLAFSVAIHADPEILLIDEVLAVGDIGFQRKCLQRIQQIKNRGCTIVIVSHEAETIGRLCDHALWLKAGQLVSQGPAAEIARDYVADFDQQSRQATPRLSTTQVASSGIELELHRNRVGSQEVEITDVRLLDPAGRPVAKLASGEPLSVEIHYRAHQAVPFPVFGVSVTNFEGNYTYCDLNSRDQLLVDEPVLGRGCVSLQFEHLELGTGQVALSIGAYHHQWEYTYDYHWAAYPLEIIADQQSAGLLRPAHRWAIRAPNSLPLPG